MDAERATKEYFPKTDAWRTPIYAKKYAARFCIKK